MESTALSNEIYDVALSAQTLFVTSTDEETVAVEFLKIVKECQIKVGLRFDPMVESAHKTHKEAISQRAFHLDPLLEAEKSVKSRIKEYRLALERERKEQERLVQEQVDREVQIKREQLLKESENAAVEGDTKRSNELAFKAVTLESGGVCVGSKATKQQGMSTPSIWRAKIVDPALVPKEFWILDEKKIQGFAREHKGIKQIPGVEIYEDISIRI